MKIQDLKKLMGSLSLHEKIGQRVQLDGGFFGAEEVPTGPCDEMGIAPWVVENVGSVLNVLGVKKVQEVQRHHLLHSRISLLFMADVVYGYKTSYPIPLALACSWDIELVEECAKKPLMVTPFSSPKFSASRIEAPQKALLASLCECHRPTAPPGNPE